MEDIPSQNHIPKPIQFLVDEQTQIDNEVNRFIQCKIIEEVMEPCGNEFISNIFFRPIKDGRLRIILNLKTFNQIFLEKVHFKMETLQSAIDAMRKDCFFGSVDLSEAFYSILICKHDRRFLRFLHKGKKY